MNRPTVLIGGGYDKDSEYEEWIQAFDGKVKLLVLVLSLIHIWNAQNHPAHPRNDIWKVISVMHSVYMQ